MRCDVSRTIILSLCACHMKTCSSNILFRVRTRCSGHISHVAQPRVYTWWSWRNLEPRGGTVLRSWRSNLRPNPEGPNVRANHRLGLAGEFFTKRKRNDEIPLAWRVSLFYSVKRNRRADHHTQRGQQHGLRYATTWDEDRQKIATSCPDQGELSSLSERQAGQGGGVITWSLCTIFRWGTNGRP